MKTITFSLILSLSFVFSTGLTNAQARINNVNATFLVQNFEALTVGSPLTISTGAATATNYALVADDPTGAGNKVGRIVTNYYGPLFRFVPTLPTGRTIADFKEISFRIWFKAAVTGVIANNYKSVFVKFDNTSAPYVNTNNAEVGPRESWIAKAYPLTGLTSGNSVIIDLGLFTELGDYFLDDVVLTYNDGISTLNKEIQGQSFGLISEKGKITVTGVEKGTANIYNISGQQVVSALIEGSTTFTLSRGIYLVKVNGTTKKCIVE